MPVTDVIITSLLSLSGLSSLKLPYLSCSLCLLLLLPQCHHHAFVTALVTCHCCYCHNCHHHHHHHHHHHQHRYCHHHLHCHHYMVLLRLCIWQFKARNDFRCSQVMNNIQLCFPFLAILRSSQRVKKRLTWHFLKK